MPDRDSGEHGIGQDASDSTGSPGQGPRQPGEPARPGARTGDEPQVPDERMAPEGPPGTPSGPLRYVRPALREAAWLVGTVAWLGFWLNIAKLHVQSGAMAEAVLTAGLFALPALIAYILRLNSFFDLFEPPGLRSLTG